MTKARFPREKAVALQYETGESVPRVLASGAGEIARQILRIADEHSIPIHEDAGLTQLLAQIPEGWQIPPETYELVSEIVCFLYGLDIKQAQQAKP
jgi:flagellar biosynthesis protein